MSEAVWSWADCEGLDAATRARVDPPNSVWSEAREAYLGQDGTGWVETQDEAGVWPRSVAQMLAMRCPAGDEAAAIEAVRAG